MNKATIVKSPEGGLPVTVNPTYGIRTGNSHPSSRPAPAPGVVEISAHSPVAAKPQWFQTTATSFSQEAASGRHPGVASAPLHCSRAGQLSEALAAPARVHAPLDTGPGAQCLGSPVKKLGERSERQQAGPTDTSVNVPFLSLCLALGSRKPTAHPTANVRPHGDS